MISIKNKKVAVIGLGKRTGVATAKMLVNLGGKVVVSDIKDKEELQEELISLKGLDVEYEFGGHGEKSLACDLIVVSPGVPLDLPFFQKVKEKKIPLISEIELSYHFTKASIIAITGTNGKTTCTGLLGNILEKGKEEEVFVGGNIGNPLIATTPKLNSQDWVVAEISSFQLETINKFRPLISIYLNFSPDHLDRHKTLEAYWQAKKRIFLNQTSSDYALINLDDPMVVKAAKDCQAKVLEISLEKEVKEGIYLNKGYLEVKIADEKEKIINIKEIPLKGKHNLQNIAFAVLAAKLTGVTNEKIKEGILTYRPESHRLEIVEEKEDGSLIVDDSKATNPDAAIKALESFHKPIILIAGGQDRKADFSKLSSVIKDKVKELILIGETKEIIAKEVLKHDFSNINIYKRANMKEAVAIALKLFKSGDLLLLSPACPSWDMYSSYQERGNDFRKNIQMLRGE